MDKACGRGWSLECGTTRVVVHTPRDCARSTERRFQQAFEAFPQIMIGRFHYVLASIYQSGVTLYLLTSII
jgi:hypothetical protein